VRALLRRGGARRMERIVLGGLLVDRLTHTASVDGQDLRLRPKEYSLLDYLARHADQIVTRSELLEKVWDLHFDPRSNVVDVHVARLRSKLHQSTGGVRLCTVRGVGYRLMKQPTSTDRRVHANAP
jgi:DNA-binding response OmpR family regulator